jgi:hypothetical protein
MDAANIIKIKKEASSHILVAHPYLCDLLAIDCFAGHKRLGFSQADIDQMKPGDFIVWENWFAVVESNIKKEDLEKNPGLINIYSSQTNDNGRDIIYAVYQKK